VHSGINSLALTETGNCHHSVPCYVLCPPLSAEGRGEKSQPSPVYCPPRHRQAAAAAQGFCTVPDHTQRNRQPNDLFARHRLGDPEGQIVEAETEAETVLAEGAALGIVVGIPEREPDDALSGGEGGASAPVETTDPVYSKPIVPSRGSWAVSRMSTGFWAMAVTCAPGVGRGSWTSLAGAGSVLLGKKNIRVVEGGDGGAERFVDERGMWVEFFLYIYICIVSHSTTWSFSALELSIQNPSGFRRPEGA